MKITLHADGHNFWKLITIEDCHVSHTKIPGARPDQPAEALETTERVLTTRGIAHTTWAQVTPTCYTAEALK